MAEEKARQTDKEANIQDLQQICKMGLEVHASDVHITAGSPPVFRIRGELRTAKLAPLSGHSIQNAVYDCMTRDQIKTFEEKQGVDFTFIVHDKYRFRANVYLQRGQISVALRPIASHIPSMDDLGLPPLMKEVALLHSGLIMITGPTGQGKSTTQASLIDYVNHVRKCHIITIEDPIEFLFKNRKSIIEQREVGLDVPSFSEALRMTLRQDPDVILVGEMRDLDTIESTLRAAETGHLVVANLHSNDSVQSLERIVSVFPGAQQGPVRVQLSLVLQVVLAQRLLPRADGKGRLAAIECLVANDAVRHLIRDNKIHQIYTVMQTRSKDGMTTLENVVKQMFQNQWITYEVAANYVKNPRELRA